MMDDGQQDICRVCRSEGSPDRPLFYPCVCTGSIKYIHQDCLVQWLRYSRKEYCELCNHRFSFTPIYAPDMPKRLPIKDIISGLVTSVATAVRFWLHYTLVAFAWLGVVPLSACRIHRSLFTGSVNSILALPLDLLSTENLLSDIFHGCIVVMCTLCVFISLVWLREHMMHGGAPEWLEAPQEDNPIEIGDGDEGEDNGMNDMDNGNGDGEGDNGLQLDVQAPANQNDNNNNNNVQNARGGGNDEINWNPIEWDRAAEELTWERLLGLDGSLVFLEHVFWVVSLNTLFILVFEFSPYHIGHFTLAGLQLQEMTKVQHFEGLLVTLCGYCVVGICLVLLHAVASIMRLNRSKKVLGLCYVVVKVCLLSVVEIGIFPLVCGWWLDVCSLSLFDATFKDREATFNKAPGTSMFLHWLFGMIYVFYFASFILLLREVLRPGVLWFLRNLNDPDFNPIQEMIHLPILRHIRRFLFSMIIFGTTVLLMVWLPIRLIKRTIPTFLPYNFNLLPIFREQAHELSLELVVLQVMMPALLEQGHTREWLKIVVRFWCIVMAWILDLRSYLLGDVPLENNVNGDVVNEHREAAADVLLQRENNQNENVNENEDRGEGGGGGGGGAGGEVGAAGGLGFVIGGGLGAAHQALLLRDGPTGFLPYTRPKLFPAKITLLLLSMCATLTIVSIFILTVPVSVGRFVMRYWLSNPDEPIHELYTTASGLYVTWLTVRLLILFGTWIPRGWAAVWDMIRRWSVTMKTMYQWTMGLSFQVIKTAVAIGLLIGFIPYMCGLLFELLLISPLRVPLTQSPIYLASENWVMGTLYVKIACAGAMMTPQNFWLRRTLERIYNDGFRNINLNFIITELAAPCIVLLGLALAVPYVISQSLVPLFVTNMDSLNVVHRRIYPTFLVTAVVFGVISFQIRQFKKLYEHIKNDKYLGPEEHERPPPSPPVAAAI
ncbi:E3 ubiquitin-protein ligase MARCH6 [Orchesella cincta]|uniref:E3 ubiquitin-protein ligase MARCHF6 n=1 Tax=Orchesella cincta TaxID=48709 RepID=A0A1D2NCT4_ORCCI|nr:E3 ubiquitin-protein ligase MARCH6 [Orchesella cincta]